MLIETCYGFPVKLRVGPNKSCFRQEMNTFCGKEISRKIWGLMVKVVGGELPMWRNHHKPDQRTYFVISTTNRASLRPAFHGVLFTVKPFTRRKQKVNAFERRGFKNG